MNADYAVPMGAPPLKSPCVCVSDRPLPKRTVFCLWAKSAIGDNLQMDRADKLKMGELRGLSVCEGAQKGQTIEECQQGLAQG